MPSGFKVVQFDAPDASIRICGRIGVAPVTPLARLNDLVGDDVEGVTLLGGEPFDQAASLAQFAALVRSRGLSVMTFTGFTLEELRRSSDRSVRPYSTRLTCSLMVDSKKDNVDVMRPWVDRETSGSTHSPLAMSPWLNDLEPGLVSDQLEVRVSTDGTVRVNGWATDQRSSDASPWARHPSSLAAVTSLLASEAGLIGRLQLVLVRMMWGSCRTACIDSVCMAIPVGEPAVGNGGSDD